MRSRLLKVLRRNPTLYRSLKSKLQVGLNPDLPKQDRHGSVWFNVSGFGEMRRDFIVSDRDLLADNAKRYAMVVARQVMLIDPHLPNREAHCEPTRIDIVGNDVRRVYRLPSFELMLEQSR